MKITMKNGEQYTMSSLTDKMINRIGEMSDSEVFFLTSVFYNGNEDIRASQCTNMARQLGYENAVFVLEAIAIFTDEFIDTLPSGAPIAEIFTSVITATQKKAASILKRHQTH